MSENVNINKLMNQAFSSQEEMLGAPKECNQSNDDDVISKLGSDEVLFLVGLTDQNQGRLFLYSTTIEALTIIDQIKGEQKNTYQYTYATNTATKNNQPLAGADRIVKKMTREFHERNRKVDVYKGKRPES
jgi:hypothetical protein